MNRCKYFNNCPAMSFLCMSRQPGKDCMDGIQHACIYHYKKIAIANKILFEITSERKDDIK